MQCNWKKVEIFFIALCVYIYIYIYNHILSRVKEELKPEIIDNPSCQPSWNF